MLEKIREYVANNRDDIVSDLRNLVKHPSISAQDVGIEECASALNEIMRDSGISSNIIKLRDGNPVVYGEVRSSRSKKTLLLYSHYDVQPVEPLDAWRYNPFSGVVTDEKVHGRGAADSKGNVIALIKAAKGFLDKFGEPPLNLKFLIEGEEEISSINLPEFAKSNRAMLKADSSLCFDGSMNPSGSASIYAGLKGLLYLELRSKTASVDMHSSLAPIAPNPVWRLMKALSTIKGDGKITVDGWYGDVKVPTRGDLALLYKLQYDEKMIMKEYGIRELVGGVKGKAALKKLIFEPTCNIAGIQSGYTSAGSKTVLPSEAFVKLDFRLVYDQKTDDLIKKLRRHLARNGFVDLLIFKLGSVEPSKTDVKAKIVKTASNAAKQVYGKKPSIFPNMWGSGPDFVFTKLLRLQSVWTGCSPPYANIHAPNEFTAIKNVLDGVCYASIIMHEFSKM
ncbi:MAG: M20/M25/M40 family metallo-hydrolase [Nitrososphaerales archaeon]